MFINVADQGTHAVRLLSEAVWGTNQPVDVGSLDVFYQGAHRINEYVIWLCQNTQKQRFQYILGIRQLDLGDRPQQTNVTPNTAVLPIDPNLTHNNRPSPRVPNLQPKQHNNNIRQNIKNVPLSCIIVKNTVSK